MYVCQQSTTSGYGFHAKALRGAREGGYQRSYLERLTTSRMATLAVPPANIPNTISMGPNG